MNPQTLQLIVTAVSTIIASGAVWKLISVRAEMANIRALAHKTEQETRDIEFNRMQRAAEYYHDLWEECEEARRRDRGEIPPPAMPPQIK